MSTHVDAPPPRNLYQEGSDTLRAQIDLAPDQFGAESEFAPQYASLYQGILGRSLLGPNGDFSSLVGIYGQAAPQFGEIQSAANTQQRQADITDVENLGGRAITAFNNANPELSALRSQIAGGAGNIDPFMQVQAGGNAAADAYSQRAISDLALGGQLGAQETRGITNDVISRFNRGGRANDPAAIAGVALGLDSAQQARLAQRQAAAATAAGLTGANNALGLQAGSANQQAQLQREALRQQSLMQAAGFLQSSQVDPFQAILGRSGSVSQAMGGYGQATGGATGLFNPFSGYAGDLYNTNYNADASARIGTANNNAALWSGFMSMIGSAIPG